MTKEFLTFIESLISLSEGEKLELIKKLKAEELTEEQIDTLIYDLVKQENDARKIAQEMLDDAITDLEEEEKELTESYENMKKEQHEDLEEFFEEESKNDEENK